MTRIFFLTINFYIFFITKRNNEIIAWHRILNFWDCSFSIVCKRACKSRIRIIFPVNHSHPLFERNTIVVSVKIMDNKKKNKHHSRLFGLKSNINRIDTCLIYYLINSRHVHSNCTSVLKLDLSIYVSASMNLRYSVTILFSTQYVVTHAEQTPGKIPSL